MRACVNRVLAELAALFLCSQWVFEEHWVGAGRKIYFKRGAFRWSRGVCEFTPKFQSRHICLYSFQAAVQSDCYVRAERMNQCFILFAVTVCNDAQSRLAYQW